MFFNCFYKITFLYRRTVTQNLEQDLPSTSGADLIGSSTSRFINELLEEENQPRTWNMSQSKDLLSFESVANLNTKVTGVIERGAF